MDKNGSGHLDKDEIREGLKAAGYTLSAAELDAAVKAADSDGNGHIDYHGLTLLLLTLRMPCKSNKLYNPYLISFRVCPHGSEFEEMSDQPRSMMPSQQEIFFFLKNNR
jgi:hypothetical protein